MISLDSPTDVAAALSEQADILQEKIESLTKSLKEIKALESEVLQMQSVDFKKYADIIVNLQMRNELYWLIKHFDDTTLDYFRNHFDKDSGLEMMESFNHLVNEAIELQKDGISPESKQGQSFAKKFWKMLLGFTGGDMNILTKLMKTESVIASDSEWMEKQVLANAFIEPALDTYFTTLGYNPLEEDVR